MSGVSTLFIGGPADGVRQDLPADPDGRPPARWVLRGHDAPGDHLYERAGPDPRGGWTMHHVRTDPAGMSE
ncbi:hypothetical protein [Plantactinospora sp. KBS50]|uniref:hypothetical protein n=1 Tax=Plantactinospora sp. KBS50 TaxID=2024580 RepID=UPI000BAAFE2A|nr:hypothetical protein [Plantactinospora sp. KBS50]ASW56129.1 hypothetical protein CIK06_21090 [Plantactinospora sp. KBS50]